VQTFICSL